MAKTGTATISGRIRMGSIIAALSVSRQHCRSLSQ
jgi:hypothetical protein